MPNIVHVIWSPVVASIVLMIKVIVILLDNTTHNDLMALNPFDMNLQHIVSIVKINCDFRVFVIIVKIVMIVVIANVMKQLNLIVDEVM